jgi:hypothetical protein
MRQAVSWQNNLAQNIATGVSTTELKGLGWPVD